MKSAQMDLSTLMSLSWSSAEAYELSPTMQNFWHLVWNLGTRPTTILQMIQKCKNDLQTLAVFYIEEVVENILLCSRAQNQTVFCLLYFVGGDSQCQLKA